MTTMKTFKRYLKENEDIKVGDTILTGRFKNSPAVVKGFGTDKKNQPTVKTTKGEISLYKFRIQKLMAAKDKSITESRKVTPRQENVFNTLYDEILFEKFGDPQKNTFLKQGIESDAIDSYIKDFDIIRKKKPKELFVDIPNVTVPKESRLDISSYKDFHQLEAVVDYIKGQRQITNNTKDVQGETSVEPIFENESLTIYRGDSAQQCVQIKGSWPFKWCVSAQSTSNLYNTYRYKDHEPTFYFVKIKTKNTTNKYHFFVVQATKGGQYFVTSSLNDGDKQMTWDEILDIQPKLKGLEDVFKHIPLQDTERQNYKRFSKGVTDIEFLKLPYDDKRMYLDIVGHKDLSPEKFDMLPDDLKSHYISFGLGLTDEQFELIQNNNPLLKRYKQITERKLKTYKDQPDQRIEFTYSEYSILDKNGKHDLVNIISSNANYSYEFAEGVGFDLSKIPKEIITGISNSTGYSYYFAERLGYDLSKIPNPHRQDIITAISSKANYSYQFAKGLGFDLSKIPKEIITGISSDAERSYYFAERLGYDLSKIPNPHRQEIITAISSNAEKSYNFVVGVRFDLSKIPKEIITTISSDVGYSYDFAKVVGFDLSKIPEEIITAISSDVMQSYRFAKGVGYDLSKIPKEIITGISNSTVASNQFASGVGFDFNKIPKEIITTISSDANYSYYFAKKMGFDFNKIPKELIASIENSSTETPEFLNDPRKVTPRQENVFYKLVDEILLSESMYRIPR